MENFKLRTNASIIFDLVEKLEAKKQVEFRKESVRKSCIKLGLKDNVKMKDIIHDLQLFYGEKSVNKVGSRRGAYYTLANAISKAPEVKKQLLFIMNEKKQEQVKEEMIDPVKEYCDAMKIQVSDIDPKILRLFPKPVKKGQEYKHNIDPRQLKNCAIFLHNIKNSLKVGEPTVFIKEEKRWKETKGTTAEFDKHFYVCCLEGFPYVKFNVHDNKKLEILNLTKEDCECIIQVILESFEKDNSIRKVIESHINNDNQPKLTFEESVIQYPEVEKTIEVKEEKVYITLDSVKLYKVCSAVLDGCTDTSTINEFILKNYITSVSDRDIEIGLEILKRDGLLEKDVEDKLLELIYETAPKKQNTTICSFMKQSTISAWFTNDSKLTCIGTLVNGLNIFNITIDTESKKDMNILLRLMLTLRPEEKIILPPGIGNFLKQKLNAKSSSIEDLTEASRKMELI